MIDIAVSEIKKILGENIDSMLTHSKNLGNQSDRDSYYFCKGKVEALEFALFRIEYHCNEMDRFEKLRDDYKELSCRVEALEKWNQ